MKHKITRHLMLEGMNDGESERLILKVHPHERADCVMILDQGDNNEVWVDIEGAKHLGAFLSDWAKECEA